MKGRKYEARYLMSGNSKGSEGETIEIAARKKVAVKISGGLKEKVNA